MSQQWCMNANMTHFLKRHTSVGSVACRASESARESRAFHAIRTIADNVFLTGAVDRGVLRCARQGCLVQGNEFEGLGIGSALEK